MGAERVISLPKRPWSAFLRTLSGFRPVGGTWRDGLEGNFDGNWRLICSGIQVTALTRTAESRGWGRLIEIIDPDNRIHSIALPCKMLTGGGELAIEILAGRGVRIEPGTDVRHALLRYLNSIADIEGEELPRALAAARTGWHGDTFVLPDRAIGGDGKAVYQPSSALTARIGTTGTLAEWQDAIAAPAVGNSRLVLGLCAAFAAPLLGPLNYPEGFGLHFRGGSSSGKTTTLEVTGSVWGGGGLTGWRQSWHATCNGIEAMAEAHCDLPLCLDELGQVRPEDAGRVAYQIAAGVGRQRALVDGSAASRREWRLVYLSTGEISLADKMREARTGMREMAGQGVRFIDLTADAGAGLGLFDVVPEVDGKPEASPKDKGRAFADRLVSAAQRGYGTAGPAFIEAFVAARDASLDFVSQTVEELATGFVAGDADGQVQRVARHFALLGAAGELAISLAILPWPTGEAKAAAGRCFADWLQQRGTSGAVEARDAIAHLRGIIERDGDARFQRIGATVAKDVVRDRLGYSRETDGDTQYLILPEAWKTIMAGRDPERTAQDLAAAGILIPDSNRTQKKVRLPGNKHPQRVYLISLAALCADPCEPPDADRGELPLSPLAVSPDDDVVAERAAFLEHSGGLDRASAERQALAELTDQARAASIRHPSASVLPSPSFAGRTDA